MKKLLVASLILFLVYVLFVGWFFSSEKSRPVLALITHDSYPFIPKLVARSYFYATGFELVNQTIEGSSAFNVVATSYDLDGFDNIEIMWLLNKLIEHGADINSIQAGYSPINAAILGNSIELVEFLIGKGANTSSLTQSATASKCQNLNSLDFAKCIHKIGKRDLSRIIGLLSNGT